MKEEKEEATEETVKPSEIVNELQKIRMSVDRFLEKFAGSLKLNEKSSPEQKEGIQKSTKYSRGLFCINHKCGFFY